MSDNKELKMTLRKGECPYCRQSRVELKGERWQQTDDDKAPWYSRYLCLDCGERYILIENN